MKFEKPLHIFIILSSIITIHIHTEPIEVDLDMSMMFGLEPIPENHIVILTNSGWCLCNHENCRFADVEDTLWRYAICTRYPKLNIGCRCRNEDYTFGDCSCQGGQNLYTCEKNKCNYKGNIMTYLYNHDATRSLWEPDTRDCIEKTPYDEKMEEWNKTHPDQG